jgi:UPF0716 protein FxsA
MRLGFLGIIAAAFLALEIVGIALVGLQIGMLQTFLWLLGAALAGGWLIRSAGAGFMPELMHATAGGQDPFRVMWRAGRRFLAGLLLIFPGAVSDVLAVLLLLTAGLPRKQAAISPGSYGPGPDRGARRSPGGQPQGSEEAIEGEFRRED